MSDKTYVTGDKGKSASETQPTSQIGATLEALFATIENRKNISAAENSYTKQLLDGKLDDLLKKVSEESLESCLAAKECEIMRASLEKEHAGHATRQETTQDAANSAGKATAQGYDSSADQPTTQDAANSADQPTAQGATNSANKATAQDGGHAADPASIPVNPTDPDSHPITKTMQSFNESLQLSQAVQESIQIQETAKALDEGIDHMRYEAADVIYHLLVLLARFDVTLDELAAELNMRMREDERPDGCVMLQPEHVRRGK